MDISILSDFPLMLAKTSLGQQKFVYAGKALRSVQLRGCVPAGK